MGEVHGEKRETRISGYSARVADITYKEGTKTSVVLNGVPFILWVPQGSHTAGDMLVYLPDDRVLATGDILVNGVVPTMLDVNIKKLDQHSRTTSKG